MKGFTLIEILAVIVIISIVLLITSTLVNNVIESAEEKTAKIAGEQILKAAEIERTNLNKNNDQYTVIYYFDSLGAQTSDPASKTLDFDGDQPVGGYLILFEDGKVEFGLKIKNHIVTKKIDSSNLEVEKFNTGVNDIKLVPYQFTCGNDLVDYRDGSTYQTGIRGNNCWTLSNMKYLPEVSNTKTKSYESPRYYVYGYNSNEVNEAITSANYKAYGVLYNYEAASQGMIEGERGVCPAGFFLPTTADWQDLENFYKTGAESGVCSGNIIGNDCARAGARLSSGTLWPSGVMTTAPEFGSANFSILPGGIFDSATSTFKNLRTGTSFWTASHLGNPQTRVVRTYTFTSLGRDLEIKTFDNANYVRCVKPL